jgi:hypothetical protein
MSYRNPTMIQPADPLAFSKGFEQAFSQQQSAFEAEIKERKRIAEETDAALAMAYSVADLGPMAEFDAGVTAAFQDGINSILESGDFANANKAEQAQMLQKVNLLKGSIQRLGEIVSVDPQDWDLRNDPILSKFRAAVLSGDKSIKFEGKGLDFKVKGSFGEISINDLTNKRIINKAPYEQAINELNSSFGERYSKTISEAFKSGKTDAEIELLKADFKNIYAERIRNLDPDVKQFLKFNVAGTDDENKMIEGMFNKIDSQILSPSKIYNRPKPPQPDTSLVFAANLGMTAAGNPASFFNRLSGSQDYTDVKITDDFKIAFNRPIEVEDEKGNITIQQKAESLDLKDSGDLETYAQALWKQYGGKDISMENRTSAYLIFKQQLINGLAQSYEEKQAELRKRVEARAQEPQIGPRKQEDQQPLSIKDQILQIETFKPNQEISVREKRNMTSGVQKKVLAELNNKKLPITYANYDRVVKYLGLDDQQSFSDAFLGRTKSDEDLLSVNI